MTQCNCLTDGFCPTLGKQMSPHLHQLCRTREDYCDLFQRQAREAGRLTLPIVTETIAPCAHRGKAIGTLTTPMGQLSVLGCDVHGETTAPHCDACPDRCAVAPRKTFDSILPARGLGPRINKWAVGMTTAPRKQETFTQSLRSLIAAGWEKPRIFAEPGSPIPEEFQGLPLSQRDEVAGAWPNYYLALQELLTRHPDADAYMVAQDDVLFVPGDATENLRQYLDRALWPAEKVGFVSIYCSKAYNQDRYDWYQLDRAWVWGACAIIWPRESLIHFLTHNAIMWRLTGPKQGMRQVDIVMGKWQKEHKRSAWYCCPSLTQHIGKTSTLYPTNVAKGKRSAKTFAGDVL